MDRPTPKDRVLHVLEAINSIRKFIKGSTQESFLRDHKSQSAVLFQFVIIGEAIRYIDDSILLKYRYAWHIPKSFRNFIAHEYHGIKMERIYYAARDLDDLEKIILEILEKEFS